MPFLCDLGMRRRLKGRVSDDAWDTLSGSLISCAEGAQSLSNLCRISHQSPTSEIQLNDMSPEFPQEKVYAEFSNGFPDPSRSHLERKIMGTNCFKSNFRNAMRDDLGQPRLFVCGSEAHSNGLGLLAKSGKTFFFPPLLLKSCLFIFFAF